MNSIDISIVIRTLNEERYLPILLNSIATQKETPRTEVIVVDSGSTDKTVAIAQHHNCRILHIERHDFSFGRSLNMGCSAAQGKQLVFISGHCVPRDAYWLARITEQLRLNTVDLTYGRQLGGPRTQSSENRIFLKYFPAQSKIPQLGFFCNNANSAINARTWAQYRFDEDLTGLEDIHLAKRLVSEGGKVGYIADAAVFHYHEENWAQVERRFEREALALQRICPELIVRGSDLIRYLAAAIAGDLKHDLLHSYGLRNCYSIVRYRCAQYLGTWRGQHSHRRITQDLRDSYFYPTQARGLPLQLASNLRNTKL